MVQSRVLDVGLGILYCFMLVQAVQGGLLDTLSSLLKALMVWTTLCWKCMHVRMKKLA